MKSKSSINNKGIIKRLSLFLSANHGSKFRINTIYILKLNIIAHIVVLLSTPLLSRLYTSSDFGQFSFFSATLAILVSFTTGRFDWSIPNARSIGATSALFHIGLISTLVTSIAIALLLIILYVIKLPMIMESSIGLMVFFFPLAMLSMGITELFNGWCVRSGHLKLIGSSKIIQSLANTKLSILCGFFKFGTIGLIGSLVVSSCISVAFFISSTRKLKNRLTQSSKTRMSAMFQRVRGEAVLSTTVSVANTLSSTAGILMIGSFFTLQELGWYALMQRLALAPVGLISSSIGTSFWSTAAEYARTKAHGELRKFYLRTTVQLSILIIPIVIACGMAPLFIGPIFGAKEWGPAGYVLLAMTPHIVGAIVFSSTNHLIVYGRQSYQLISDIIVILLTGISVFFTAKYNLGIVVCTAAISFSVLIGYILRFFLHLHANATHRNDI